MAFHFLQCVLSFQTKIPTIPKTKVTPTCRPSKASTLVAINMIKTVKEFSRGEIFLRFKFREGSYWCLTFTYRADWRNGTHQANEHHYSLWMNIALNIIYMQIYVSPILLETLFSGATIYPASDEMSANPVNLRLWLKWTGKICFLR